MWGLGGKEAKAPSFYTLTTNVTQQGNALAAETTIFTYPLTASKLAVNKQAILVRMAGAIVGSANNVRLRMKLGGLTFFDTGNFVTLDNVKYVLECEIVRVSQNSQRCVGRIVTGIGAFDFADDNLIAADLSTALNIDFTAVGTNNNDITRDYAKVFFEGA